MTKMCGEQALQIGAVSEALEGNPALTGRWKRPPVRHRSVTEAAIHPRYSICNDWKSAAGA